MVQKLKLVAVVGACAVAGGYLDKFAKEKNWIKPDSSIGKFSPAIGAGLAGLAAHMAGLL